MQMVERLKNAKREKGMSAEVWGNLVSSFCDAVQVTNPQMRHQYFIDGLRNKERKPALATSMVSTIPQAVMLLLYKNMHIPVKEDSEFADEAKAKPSSDSNMMQQMMTMMQQTQNRLTQQQKQLIEQHSGSPRNRGPRPDFAAAAYEDTTPHLSVETENAMNASSGGRCMGPDKRTQDGTTVRGRCILLGCSRETCRYDNMTCNNCKQRGHVDFECGLPKQQNSGGNNRFQSSARGYSGQLQNGNGYQQRGCFFCDQRDHRVVDCPVRSAMIRMVDQNAAGTAPVRGPVAAQH
ncbi:hypothetical protein PI126_g15590 [Phytophthora idaei]|nr:hypothetical protein PI126_g15590 [Phytophthora idaei]